MQNPNISVTPASRLQLVMAYAAELELEVDRLRRRDQFLQWEARNHIGQMIQLCKHATAPQGETDDTLLEISKACGSFGEILRDLNEPSGYHPAFDQVTAIAVRPLAEQAFRGQQRLSGSPDAVLRLDLQCEHIDWFPARLRHILDNLIFNALRNSDGGQGEIRVGLAIQSVAAGYELQLTDNANGPIEPAAPGLLELFYRAAPTRSAGLGLGLAVVTFLVEQCCGTISVRGGEGQGTSVTVVLPRFGLGDHVD